MKPFASVILSSVGVSLHLFQVRLLPMTACAATLPGLCAPLPRCGVSPAVYLCGRAQCVGCALRRAPVQSRSAALMSGVVIRSLPWETRRWPGWREMLRPNLQGVCSAGPGPRLGHPRHSYLNPEDAQDGTLGPAAPCSRQGVPWAPPGGAVDRSTKNKLGSPFPGTEPQAESPGVAGISFPHSTMMGVHSSGSV